MKRSEVASVMKQKKMLERELNKVCFVTIGKLGEEIGSLIELTVLHLNKAVYTAESVACDWAGAVRQKLPEKRRKNKCVTNRPTNRHCGV